MESRERVGEGRYAYRRMRKRGKSGAGEKNVRREVIINKGKGGRKEVCIQKDEEKEKGGKGKGNEVSVRREVILTKA